MAFQASSSGDSGGAVDPATISLESSIGLDDSLGGPPISGFVVWDYDNEFSSTDITYDGPAITFHRKGVASFDFASNIDADATGLAKVVCMVDRPEGMPYFDPPYSQAVPIAASEVFSTGVVCFSCSHLPVEDGMVLRIAVYVGGATDTPDLQYGQLVLGYVA